MRRLQTIAIATVTAALGVAIPALFPPASILSQAQAQNRMVTNRPVTVTLVNNAGIPLMVSLSSVKPYQLAPGKATQFPFTKIADAAGEVNILVYSQRGELLLFGSNYNPAKNDLTVSVKQAPRNSRNAHGSVNIKSNGTVRFI